MKIVDFIKFPEPKMVGKFKNIPMIATFNIEFPIGNDDALIWKGWSIRQYGESFYLQAPIAWAPSTRTKGPLIAIKSREHAQILAKIELSILMSHNIKISKFKPVKGPNRPNGNLTRENKEKIKLKRKSELENRKKKYKKTYGASKKSAPFDKTRFQPPQNKFGKVRPN